MFCWSEEERREEVVARRKIVSRNKEKARDKRRPGIEGGRRPRMSIRVAGGHDQVYGCE